jgi:hypothetical protein
MGARGTCADGTSAHNSDMPSNINESLLLPPTIAMCYMTSDDHGYCWIRGMRVVADGPYSSDGCSDINGPSLLAPTVVTSIMTLVACHYLSL